MADGAITVQSINPLAGYPVAVTFENVPGVGSAGIQWMQARSSGQLVGQVAQANAPWSFTGSVQATLTGSPTPVQAGSTGTFQGFVVASVPGLAISSGLGVITQQSIAVYQATTPWLVAGSLSIAAGSLNAAVSQVTSPWVTQAGSSGQFQGFTVASVPGGITVAFGGSLSVAQQGVWSVTVAGSVFAGVSQVTSPWVTRGGSSGDFIGFVVASVPGLSLSVNSGLGVLTQQSLSVYQATTPWIVAGSLSIAAGSMNVAASQVTSPWVIRAGSTGDFQGFVVASVPGLSISVSSGLGVLTQQSISVYPATSWSMVGSMTVAGSVFAGVSQVGSPWAVFAGSTGTFQGFVGASVTNIATPVTVWAGAGDPGSSTLSTRSWVSGPLLRMSLEQGTLSAGANGALLDFNNAAIGANVTSLSGGIGALNVSIVSSGPVRASVSSDALGGLLDVNLARGSINLSGADGATLDGSDSTIRASVRSTSGFRPVMVALTDALGSQLSVFSVNAVGSVFAAVSQVTSPWAVFPGSTGVFAGFVVASVPAPVLVQGSVGVGQIGAPWSVVGSASVQGSVFVSQVTGDNWSIVGSVRIPAITVHSSGFTNAPEMIRLAAYASDPATPPTTVSHAFATHITADLQGRLRVVVDGGSLNVYAANSPWAISGSATVVGSVFAGVTQISSPWVVTGSATVLTQGSITAFPGGSWSMVGTMTVAGSVFAAVSQVTSPWITRAGSSGDFQGFVVASVPGLSISVNSGLGVLTQQSITVFQGNSPWIVQQGSTGQFVGFMVASVPGLTISVNSGLGVLTQQSISVYPAVSWTVMGSMTVAGSVFAGASQVTSPWVTLPGSTGGFQGFVVASIPAPVAITGSVGAGQIGTWSVQATQAGAPWSVIGSAFAVGFWSHSAAATVFPNLVAIGGYAQHPNSGTPSTVESGEATRILTDPLGRFRVAVDTAFLVGSVTVAGSVFAGVSQVSSPWAMFPGSTGTFQGFMVASIPAPVLVQGSVGVGQIGAPWSFVGSAAVTQVTSPWVVIQGSTGQFTGFNVVSLIGQPTTTVSLIGTISTSVAGTLVVSFEGPMLAAVASTTQGAGVAAIAGSATAPFSTAGGALNVRAMPAYAAPILCYSSTVFSAGGPNSATVQNSFVVIGTEGYTSFLFTLDMTLTNSPSTIRFRPFWWNGTSWFEHGVGFWSDMRFTRLSVISYSPRVYAGPVLGPQMSLVITTDVVTGGQTFTVRQATLQFTQTNVGAFT